MKKLLRIIVRGVIAVAALAVALGAAFVYLIYTPPAALPQLSGTLTRATIEKDGPKRTYLTYVPRGLPKGAPLVLVMHGSGENGTQLRLETGYAFERLADEHGFAVVYPSAYEGYWDACGVEGAVDAKRLGIDDVRFLTGVVDALVADVGVDAGRVFAAGISRGGAMALRLALEAPSRFRAVAAVSTNVPTPENFKCKPAGGTPSVMIMNGTEDPLVPFNGGQVNLLGFFYRNGTVLSSRASGQYFADWNHIAGLPSATQSQAAGGVEVRRMLWRDGSRVEVELVAVHGGGHGLPQPYRRRPRILGPSPMDPNGAAVIWAFFARQRP